MNRKNVFENIMFPMEIWGVSKKEAYRGKEPTNCLSW